MKNRAADITLSIIFILMSLVVGAGLAAVSVMFPMISDSCGANNCNVAVLEIAWPIALVGAPASTLVFIILTIVALARRRTAWYLPLVGMLVAGLIVVAAAMAMAFSVQGFLG